MKDTHPNPGSDVNVDAVGPMFHQWDESSPQLLVRIPHGLQIAPLIDNLEARGCRLQLLILEDLKIVVRTDGSAQDRERIRAVVGAAFRQQGNSRPVVYNDEAFGRADPAADTTHSVGATHHSRASGKHLTSGHRGSAA